MPTTITGLSSVTTTASLISGSNLTSGTSSSNGPWTTASISPDANNLIMVAIVIANGASTNPTTPTVSGNGITYTLVKAQMYDSTSTSRRELFVFRGLNSSPTTGAITITPGETSTGALWSVDQFSIVDTSGTNGSGAIVQSVGNSDESGSVSTLTATLAAFSNTLNATYGACAAATGTLTITQGSGFTKLAGVGTAAPGIDLATEWKNTNDTSVDFTLSANDFIGVIGVEIKNISSNPMVWVV